VSLESVCLAIREELLQHPEANEAAAREAAGAVLTREAASGPATTAGLAGAKAEEVTHV